MRILRKKEVIAMQMYEVTALAPEGPEEVYQAMVFAEDEDDALNQLEEQLKEQVAYYMNNAQYILKGLQEAGFTVSGGVNAPYIWLKAPNGMTSWEFFDYLLENVNVVGTPGSGFGPSGEHYFRLTAFGSYENTVEAVDRLKKIQL